MSCSRMAKIRPNEDPSQIQVNPISLVCPFCGAKPGYTCETALGDRLEVVHVARIKAAVERDAAMKAAIRKD
jgi:hypothetical protein